MEHPIKLTDTDKTPSHEEIIKQRNIEYGLNDWFTHEKPKELIEEFDFAQVSVIDELNRIGATITLEPLPHNRVFVADSDTMSKDFNALAFYYADNDTIFISENALDDKLKLKYILTHELVHRYSQTYWSKVESGEIVRSRIGYQLESPWKNSIGPTRMFLELNEICTDMITAFALKHKGVKLDTNFYTYLNEESGAQALINHLLTSISNKNEWEFSEAWDFFERGAITDAWPVFRKIDEACGPGSSRILGHFQITKTPEYLKDWQIELNKLILIYFLIADTSKRDEISDLIKDHLKTKPAAPEQETPAE